MKDHYTIPEFYLLLKLGIFKEGKVGNWGYVSSGSLNHCFLKKPIAEYENPLVRKQLGIGLYLLDLYLLEKNNNQGTYIMVISVCRTTLDYKEQIYVLTLSSVHPVNDIKQAIMDSSLSRKRKSVFQRKSRRATFDASPINSVTRKH